MYLVWRIKIIISDRKLEAAVISGGSATKQDAEQVFHTPIVRAFECATEMCVCDRNSNLMCVNSDGTRQS